MQQIETKSAQRVQLRARRAARPPAEKQAIDQGIFQMLAQDAQANACKVIFVYISTNDEVDTQKIIKKLLSEQKTVCVPLCGAHGSMTARRIDSFSALTPGKFLGILEPSAQSECILPEDIDLVLAPCLAADTAGYRLGYGGGYYDRFLAHTTNATLYALCAADCVLPTVHPEAHDIPCHKIITEREVLIPYEK